MFYITLIGGIIMPNPISKIFGSIFSGIASLKNASKTTPLKASVSTSAAKKSEAEENEMVELSPVEENVENKISSGQLTKNKKIKESGDYTYTADGTETFKQIKEALGLADGVLRRTNSSLFDKYSSHDNYDDIIPDKGTKIAIYAEDLPSKSVDFKDDDGNVLSGFKQDYDGSLYYIVKSGDTKTGINEMLANKCFRKYSTHGLFEGYGDDDVNPLQPGDKITIPEKGLLGKFLASIADWFDSFFS